MMRGVEQIPFVYDAMCAFLEWRGLKAWRLWLVSAAKGRVLDVGCGTGRNLPLYPSGTRVVGVDPSRDNLARARRRAPGVPLVQASAEALPFRSAAFDTAISGFVFCSVPDPLSGLAEVRRVLAPGGVLRMLEHVRSRSPRWARFQDFIQPAWTRIAGGCHPNRDTEANVERAGFRIDPDDRRARDNTRRFQARALP
jgi:ubiquinone/menaquinone biosynthesis C-methylase UbiE